jgi:polysaccharide pyruvyl transferase WcaK-like protein
MIFCNPVARMKTLLVGNFGAKNIGDELILASAIDRYPEVLVATADRKYSQKFLEKKFETVEPFPTGIKSCTHFLFNRDRSLWSYRKDVDLIVFPGGGLFAIKNKAWWIWGVTVIGLRKMFPRARIELKSQGVDRPKNWFQKIILHKVLKNVHSITVRDKESAEVLLTLGKEVPVVGDAVETWLENKVEEFKSLKVNESLKIVNARAHWLGKWPEADLFLAMEEGDLQFASTGIKKIFPQTISETFEIFASAKEAVGQRLHFLILAKAFGANVKTLGVPYAEKVEAWCGEKGI